MGPCPADGQSLTVAPDGTQRCGRCQARWLTDQELELRCPGAKRVLAVESREDSLAYVKPRQCPDCRRVLTPLRISTAEQWIERCPDCERVFLEVQDERTLQNFLRTAKRNAAYQSLAKEDRAELGQALAGELKDRQGLVVQDLSNGEAVLLAAGIPVVRKFEGDATPIVTWAFALAFTAIFLAGKVDPENFGPDVLAWPSGSFSWSVLTAGAAHFGWIHLLGNLGFFIAFGRGVEKRVHRGVYALGFLALLPLTLLAEWPLAVEGTHVGGASGAIAAVLGVCAWVQPQARVLAAFLRRIPFEVPLGAFVVLWFLLQYAMWAAGIAGVAWGAHVAGVLSGLLVLGPLARRLSR
ncbi:MAG: rhomboid family intramembrane serine protease [Myxococcaceae bacterium]|nr:rhomboid family intramembrane serine protease [Myxococcaceae bacterium]